LWAPLQVGDDLDGAAYVVPDAATDILSVLDAGWVGDPLVTEDDRLMADIAEGECGAVALGDAINGPVRPTLVEDHAAASPDSYPGSSASVHT
jgi:hypothetical protein